jgi:hypothetical protein
MGVWHVLIFIYIIDLPSNINRLTNFEYFADDTTNLIAEKILKKTK